MEKAKTKTITVEVRAEVYKLLEVLTNGQYAPKSVEGVVDQLSTTHNKGL